MTQHFCEFKFSFFTSTETTKQCESGTQQGYYLDVTLKEVISL